MKLEQYLSEVKRSRSFMLSIDFDVPHLSCRGIPELEIDQSFGSLAELEQVYRARIAPIFEGGHCFDAMRGSTATAIDDMQAFAAELRACGFDWEEPSRVPGDEVEDLMAELVTRIRRELNRALGPAPTTLENVVLVVGDMLVKPAIKDPPALAGLDEGEIAKVVDGGKNLRWMRGDTIDFGMSHEDVGTDAIDELYDDPEEYGPEGMLGAILDLAAARIEANPRLRDNVTIPGSLRILFAFESMEYVLFERRALAREFAEEPALAYFQRCSDGLGE